MFPQERYRRLQEDNNVPQCVAHTECNCGKWKKTLSPPETTKTRKVVMDKLGAARELYVLPHKLDVEDSTYLLK